ncbi:MAG: tRNA pseudouridine(55) synthase TruB [Chloroflexota bacterium]
MIDGILPVDKPQGWTSHDVVARVRRLAGQRQVGHSGTLDPLATGLLLVVLGRATKLSSYLMSSPKTYLADIALGVTTATDDAEAPPMTVADPSHIRLSDVETCIPQFLGTVAQVPPAYAAVRQGGKKLYQLARRGDAVHVEPRQVHIYELRIVKWAAPVLRLYIRCGPGTYVRSLARDIGAALGVGAYLHALRRLSSGTFTVAEAHLVDELQGDALLRAVCPLDRAVLHIPAVVLNAVDSSRAAMGQPIDVDSQYSGTVRVYASSGTLIALGDCAGRVVKPFRVFEREAGPVAARH